MRILNLLSLCMLLMVSVLDSSAQRTVKPKPAVKWGQMICGKLDTLLMQPMFKTSQVALMVYDLTADSVVYAVNERQTMRPASTMKIATAVTALDVLGGNYRFKTGIGYKGEIRDSILFGDVHIKGGMDPLFDDSNMHELAMMLADSGVKAVDGNVIIDQSMRDTLLLGEGWCWDDDNPVLLPFVYHRNLTDNWFPLPVTGTTIEQGFVDTLKLKQMDEALADTMVVQEPQDTLPVIWLGEVGHGIGAVLVPMMKKSDNYCAEATFYQIAAAQSALQPATAKLAQRAVGRMIGRVGLKASDFRVADGSGLSLYNYVSAELLTKMLRYAYRKKSIYRHFSPSLPVAGEDGTLKRRMRKTAAAGNVRAKTGTVTGIISLAGYCTASNGNQLAFAIINQGVLKGKTARDFQDQVCEVLVK